jgi:hypothetical protein
MKISLHKRTATAVAGAMAITALGASVALAQTRGAEPSTHAAPAASVPAVTEEETAQETPLPEDAPATTDQAPPVESGAAQGDPAQQALQERHAPAITELPAAESGRFSTMAQGTGLVMQRAVMNHLPPGAAVDAFLENPGTGVTVAYTLFEDPTTPMPQSYLEEPGFEPFDIHGAKAVIRVLDNFHADVRAVGGDGKTIMLRMSAKEPDGRLTEGDIQMLKHVFAPRLLGAV